MNFNGKIDHSLVPKIRSALGLKRHIVGITLFKDQENFEHSKIRVIHSPLSYCSVVRLATLGYARKARYEHIRCPGAVRALGLAQPDKNFLSGNRYLSLGLYKNIAISKETSKQVSLIPSDVCGLVAQPLMSCVNPPDIVIFICDAYQAMRIVQGYIYHFGPMDPMNSMGMQGVCAELTARPYITQSINVSLLCSNTRFTCAWEEGELGVGMPYKILPQVADGVLKTLNRSESDKKKRAIMDRASNVNTEMDIRLGSAYYKR
jgi:uncharacterized protein (DUF169 family)